MSFISDIGKNISSKGKELSQKAKVMSETSSLNNIIKAEEYKIDFQYKAIGKLYFEKYQDAPEEEFSEAVETIKSSIEKIQKTKEEITKVRSKFNCPKCGAPFKHGALFCSKCGEKLPEETKPVNDTTVIPDGAQKCEKCGNILKSDALFCNVCGSKLQANPVTAENSQGNAAEEPSAADILTSDRKAIEDTAVQAEAVPDAVISEPAQIPEENKIADPKTNNAASSDQPSKASQPAETPEKTEESKGKKICPKCQNEMLDEDIFCNECGAKYE